MTNRFLVRTALPVTLLLAAALGTVALRPSLPASAADTNASATTDAKADAKADGTSRQTAHPWTGSPLGPGDAFEMPGRAELLRIDKVMDDLKLRPGSAVADVGAGGGWFSMLAARRVGPKGRVYAEDILPKYVRFIRDRARRMGFKNVRAILGTTTDPKLPRNSVNAVLILNAYHEFEQPLSVLRKINRSMKPGARLAFIERDDDDLRAQALDAIRQTGKPKHRVDERPDGNEFTDDHRLALPIVEREAAQVGFSKVTSYDLGEDNYVLVVEKK